MPDALVLCHEPTRTHLRGLPHYRVPSLGELREASELMARVVNPAVRTIGVSINTAALPEAEAMALLERTEREMGLPAVDPFRQGAGRLADALG
jgi:uncharacterized NAD-dependent epimerase/dehydratase family protein